MLSSVAQPRRKEMIAVAALAIAMLVGNFCCPTAFGQTLSPLTTFGSNGWLAPGSNPYLTTTNDQRGIGWNPTRLQVTRRSSYGAKPSITGKIAPVQRQTAEIGAGVTVSARAHRNRNRNTGTFSQLTEVKAQSQPSA